MLGIDAIGHLAIAGSPSATYSYAYSFVASGASFHFTGFSITGSIAHVTTVVVPERIRKAAAKLYSMRQAASTLYNARIRG